MKKHLFRSPLLWISAIIMSGLLGLYSFHFFPKTFPIISLDISMDRSQALDKAKEIAQENNFGPQDYQSAVTFDTDRITKTFVELEGGGKDALVEMMKEKLYMPYTWHVRHFKPFEKNETAIQFTPDGKPYNFVETISETASGAQLTKDDAQQVAQQYTAAKWNIDFDAYILVESSQQTQPSERIDHTLVYELRDKKIGEGLYRLKIQVSGDKVTQLVHFVKVPEGFTRRYAHMRSANNTTATTGMLLVLLLYIIGGCGFGLYFLTQKRWTIWQQPLKWATLIACSTTLTFFNKLPSFWMHYNTSLSSSGFIMFACISLLVSFLYLTLSTTICIMTAESLTRRAFGQHPQLWRSWSTDSASSYSILGRTLGGYCLVAFDLAFVILFYSITTKFFGWWAPSDILFNPNILSSYAPWFSPLANSLNAAFLEECLFRAIPLAGAALLGNYFGKRNLWITAAFILQAVIFGAAHANYPTQPSYARLIELIIPSFIWGLTYLRFGLMPTIICHFTYDVIWFSIPVFLSSAPYFLLYKAIIVAGTLLPLLIVFYARIKKGAWHTLEQKDTNLLWQPPTMTKKKEPEIVHTKTDSIVLPKKTMFFIYCLGIIGFFVWILATPFSHDGVTITLTRDDAIQQAQTFLQQKNISLNAPWKTLPLIFNNYGDAPSIAAQHKFIWQVGGKQLYYNLLGTHLQPAHWTIRCAQFEGDIVKRAEEHLLLFFNKNVWRYFHKLPETEAGAQLTKQQAEPIVFQAIKEKFNLDPTTLKAISAQETQHPNRKDWLFIFADPAVYPLEKGQARINVLVAGDKVVDAIRIIHVPEEWERNEMAQQQMVGIILLICLLLFFICFFYIFIRAFLQPKPYLFSKGLFFKLVGIFSTLLIINCINQWPTVAGILNTSEPLINQLFIQIALALLGCLFKAISIAAAITYIMGQREKHTLPKNYSAIIIGISGGLFLGGIFALLYKIMPSIQPLWPNYAPLAFYNPVLAAATASIMSYIMITFYFSLLALVVDRFTNHWQKNTLFAGLLFILLGLISVPLHSLNHLPIWLLAGTAVGTLLFFMYRFMSMRLNNSLISLVTGSLVILHIVHEGMFNAYPQAAISAMISIIIVGCISLLWFKKIDQ